MKRIFTLLFTISFLSAFSQSATCPALITSNYTVTCSSPCITVTVAPTIPINATTSYNVASIPYAPFSYTAGTDATYIGTLLLYGNDDEYGDAVPFFNFCFYGNTYNQVVLGSNDNMTFDLTQANAYDPYSITGPLPGAATGTSAAAVDNAILFPWNDIYSDIGSGTFRWIVYGTAPCRQFVYSCNDVPLFDGSLYCGGLSTTAQVVLYEGTNIIDVYIANRVSCAGWNGGLAVTGICNSTGSSWVCAPGENATTFGATNEAWRFTPAGASSYTYTWYDSTRTVVLGTGTSISVCPTLTGNNKYYVQAVSTMCSTVTLWDSVIVTKVGSGSGSGAIINTFSSTNPTVCGKCDGTITLVGGITPFIPDTVYYNLNGVPQPPIYTTAGADSTIIVTGLCAGTYDNITVHNGSGCPSIVGPAVLTNPPITASFSMIQHIGCTGDTVYITNNSTPAGYQNYWKFSDGSPLDSIDINPVHTFTNVGTDTITLVYSTYYACYDTIKQTITFGSVLVSNFILSPDSVCLGSSISFTNTTVSSAPANYTWDFGDGITSTLTNPTHVYSVAGIFDVSLTSSTGLGCVSTITNPVDVVSISARSAFHDTAICNTPNLTLNLIPTVIGGYSTINYSWNPTTNIGSTTTESTVFSGYNNVPPGYFFYTCNASIVLPSGAVCQVSDTFHVVSYQLIANFNAVVDTVCLGTPITFNNTSTFYDVPPYTSFTWEFGDGQSADMFPTHTYNAPGNYNVSLVLTDSLHCVSAPFYEDAYVVSVKVRTFTHDTSVCLVSPMPITASIQVYPSSFTSIQQIFWNNNYGDPSNAYLSTPSDSITNFFGSAGYPNAFYQYQFNGLVVVENGATCSSSDTEDIYVYPPVQFTQVTPSQTISWGSSIQLQANTLFNQGIYWTWLPDNGTLNNPNINDPICKPVDSVTTYTISALSQFGCRADTTITITLAPNIPPFIPNAFSPNNDGNNDFFYVRNIGLSKLVEMRIFNRWGTEIFMTINPEKGWDGTYKGEPQDIGTYFYQIILAYPDGIQKTYSGDFTLVR